MLRKDVKLGFAIGGIMLAVVIVYVLVVPNGDRKNVSVVNDDTQATGKTDSAIPAGNDSKIAEPEIADNHNAPPADPIKSDLEQPPTTAPSGNSSANSATPTGNGPDWNKLLNQGASTPTMMSETPMVPSNHPAPPTPDAAPTPSPDKQTPDKQTADKQTADKSAADQPAGDASAVAVNTLVNPGAASDKTQPDLSMDTSTDKATPATQPAASGQTTHVVQSGETLTSIAAAAYGDSHKWKHIAKANPNVDPDRLATGTKLIIPALKSSVAASTATLASATIDSQTQYEVQPNDSLYRISMKLYGKADHVDKLYDANKDVIGSDPKRLKLNMILKLTDPPTVSLTASAR
jgi:nucleoid-associated protein YgaU